MPNTVYIISDVGTPSSTKPADVASFLTEFLTDPEVIDLPWLIRQVLVRGLIVPGRAPKSAKKYTSVWTNAGSPLLVNSELLRENLEWALQSTVILGMLYGEPSLKKAFRSAVEFNPDRIVLVPLFPQYAGPTTGATTKKAEMTRLALAPNVPMKVYGRFHTEEYFLDSVAALIRRARIEGQFVLFSFHGLPEARVRAATPYCLEEANCCDRPMEETGLCYRAQCFATARALVKKLDLGADEWSISFQSRLGRRRWLRPYTDQTLNALPTKGIKRVVVVSPSFVSDCLETLEELDIEGREAFIKAGGEEFVRVSCLNARADFAKGLADALRNF